MKRKIEIFSADCPVCKEAVEQIKAEACNNCEIIVHNMNDKEVYGRSKQLGISSIPAVVIDGKLASCCNNGGINIQNLKTLGLGKSL